jgi:hypothetical protein
MRVFPTVVDGTTAKQQQQQLWPSGSGSMQAERQQPEGSNVSLLSSTSVLSHLHESKPPLRAAPLHISSAAVEDGTVHKPAGRLLALHRSVAEETLLFLRLQAAIVHSPCSTSLQSAGPSTVLVVQAILMLAGLSVLFWR